MSQVFFTYWFIVHKTARVVLDEMRCVKFLLMILT